MKNHLKQYGAIYIIPIVGIGGIIAAVIYLFGYVLPNLGM